MKGMERNMAESLCEKSMNLVSNVIKMSAFSLAKRSLGSTITNTDPRVAHLAPLISTEAVPVKMTKPLMRAEQPQANTKQTYLVGPDGVDVESSSSYSSSTSQQVVKEDMNVDGRASDYIRKFRKKNQVIGSENPSSKVLLRSRVVK